MIAGLIVLACRLIAVALVLLIEAGRGIAWLCRWLAYQARVGAARLRAERERQRASQRLVALPEDPQPEVEVGPVPFLPAVTAGIGAGWALDNLRRKDRERAEREPLPWSWDRMNEDWGLDDSPHRAVR